MGTREFHIQGRLYQHVKGQWESFPPGGAPNAIAHVSVAPSSANSAKNQLLLNVTPSIKGGPTKVLVDDLAAPQFRHKLTNQVAKDNAGDEIYILQWSYKSQAFGLKCNSHSDAKNLSNVLNECRVNSSSSPQTQNRQPKASIKSLPDEDTSSSCVNNDNEVFETDDAKPLMRVGNFVKRTGSVKRQNSQSVPHNATNPIHNAMGNGSTSSLDGNSVNSSMLRLLDSIRQENKREREQVKERLAKIENMLETLIKNVGKGGASPPANNMMTPQIIAKGCNHIMP